MPWVSDIYPDRPVRGRSPLGPIVTLGSTPSTQMTYTTIKIIQTQAKESKTYPLRFRCAYRFCSSGNAASSVCKVGLAWLAAGKPRCKRFHNGWTDPLALLNIDKVEVKRLHFAGLEARRVDGIKPRWAPS
jgi:hypothetical protein